jgi:hypothetical protein
MPIHVANFFDADRRSATAGEDMTMGMLVKVEDAGDGTRRLMKLADGDTAEVVSGKWGVVYKVSTDSNQVDVTEFTTTQLERLGDRRVTVSSGDAVIEVRKGAIVGYTADLLHDSLNPAEGGTLPEAGDKLEIKGSQWCEASTGGAITTLAGRCYGLIGSTVLIELVY